MNIIIEDKVLNYILEKNYEGLLLKTRNQSLGWAGCKRVILVEFIKEYSKIIENRFSCKTYKVDGIKVLIPYELDLEGVIELRISEVFSSFSKEMLLIVETTDI